MGSQLIFLIVLSLTIGIIIGYYLTQTMPNSLIDLTNFKLQFNENKSLKLKSHIQLIDLNKQGLENFTCIKTKMLFDLFQTTICLHDIKKDIYVSQTIMNQKIWEENLVTKILRILLKNPEYALIDIGANIGTYTMYSSSIGRKTISIECYQPNIDRIVRAIQIENTSKYVTLIENAIYNQSGEYLELSKDNSNVGGQALITNQTMEYLSLNSNPFRVVTTRFDDLYPIFIKNKISIAIMKIDIQLSEIFLCQSGYKIFDLINIVLVQMEWSDIKLKKDYADFIIDFFTERNYLSVSTDNCQILNSTNTNYTTWGTPFDIYWIKSDYYHICRS